MSTISKELRYALRTLVKSPGFTAVIVLTLALGIGANTAIYTLIDAVVLRPLPVREPDRLVEIEKAWAYPDYVDFRNRLDVFSSFAAFASRDEMRLGQGQDTELIGGSLVSLNYFSTLGVSPSIGRTFQESDAQQPVAVIGHDLWQRKFAGATSVLGQTLLINGQSVSIIGVAPRRFRGTSLTSNPQVWMPLTAAPQIFAGPMADLHLTARDFTWLRLIGRLKPGVEIERAQVTLDNVNQQIQRENPDVQRESAIVLHSVTSTALGMNNEEALNKFVWALAIMVGFVLLVASANVANLVLARALRGRKEFAMRLALGAQRRHLARQILAESLVLSVLGGLAGLIVAFGLLRLLSSFELPGKILIGTLGIGLDWRMLAFSLVLSLIVGLLFGLTPAFQASRPDLVTTIKDQVPAQGHSKARLRNAFVVVQIAFSLVLLIAGGLFVRSLRSALTTQLGFDAEQVAFATVNLGQNDYDPARAEAFYRQAVERLQAVPGVESASWANLVPFRRARVEELTVQGHQPAESEDTSVLINYVMPGYFKTLGLSLVRGQDLTAREGASAPKVVVVNQALADRYWPGQSGLGQRISLNGGEDWSEVIGVVRDSKYRNLSEPPTPYVYRPLLQHMEEAGVDEMNLLVRTRDPEALVPTLRRELGQFDQNLPVLRAKTLREHVGEVLMPQRMGATFLGSFSLLALALAAVGIYGLLSYLVSMRTHEIGVRMALGASKGEILRMVIGRSLAPLALGIAAGLVIAFWATRLIVGFLFGVSGLDPATYVVTVLLLAGVALLACYLPALRASRVSPTVALRQY